MIENEKCCNETVPFNVDIKPIDECCGSNAGGGGNGTPGAPGKSAYQIAVEAGFVGTESDWLASLGGSEGKSAYQVWLDDGHTGTEQDFFNYLASQSGNLETIVSQVTEGGIDEGENIQIGTLAANTQAWKELLFKAKKPIINAPTFQLTHNVGTAREVGDIISVMLTFNFNRGEIKGNMVGGNWDPNALQGYRAGAASFYNLNGSTSVANNRNISNYTVVLGTNTFTGTVSYNQGDQPKDGNGNNIGTPLDAGTSPLQTVSFLGLYKTFYGPTISVPTDADMLRALPNSALSNISQFELNSGTTGTVYAIGVPPGKSLGSVIDLDASNLDITSEYVLINSNFTAKDASGNVVSGYKLYAKTNSVPYTLNHRHRVTLI